MELFINTSHLGIRKHLTKNDIEELITYKCPMFISLDQEGGRVSRLPTQSGKFESALDVGNRDDKKYAYDFGKRTGSVLYDIGFNLNYAPVCDIYSNPQNTVIADRSYGKTPKRVSNIAIEVMKGLRDENIIPTIKHFPGHGDTAIDSHVGLPIVKKALSELLDCELIPFENAIKNNIEMIMVGHIVVDKVDDMPTTLSYEMVTNVLRNKLMYDGVVITDDIGLKAITEQYSIGEAAVLAIKAVCDIVLCSLNILSGEKAYLALLEAYFNNEISEQRIDESLR